MKVTEIFSALREYIVLSEKISQNKEEITRLREEIKAIEQKVERITEVLQKLPNEISRIVRNTVEEELKDFREKEAAERRIALLELENRFLKSEKSLPPIGKEKKEL